MKCGAKLGWEGEEWGGGGCERDGSNSNGAHWIFSSFYTASPYPFSPWTAKELVQVQGDSLQGRRVSEVNAFPLQSLFAPLLYALCTYLVWLHQRYRRKKELDWAISSTIGALIKQDIYFPLLLNAYKNSFSIFQTEICMLLKWSDKILNPTRLILTYKSYICMFFPISFILTCCSCQKCGIAGTWQNSDNNQSQYRGASAWVVGLALFRPNRMCSFWMCLFWNL